MAPAEGSPFPYWSIKNGESNNGGMRELNPPGMPPTGSCTSAIEDIDAALAKVGELGGKTMSGPDDIGIAKIAVVATRRAPSFALYDGQHEP